MNPDVLSRVDPEGYASYCTNYDRASMKEALIPREDPMRYATRYSMVSDGGSNDDVDENVECK